MVGDKPSTWISQEVRGINRYAAKGSSRKEAKKHKKAEPENFGWGLEWLDGLIHTSLLFGSVQPRPEPVFSHGQIAC